MTWWPAVVFGWPAVLLALALSVIGIAKRMPLLLAAAAIIAAPFSLYLVGSPRIGWLGFGIPLLLAAAGAAVHYRRPQIAWPLLVPVVALVGWVASLVIRE